MESRVQSHHWKQLERLKDTAIGNSINHYSDDEVCTLYNETVCMAY